MNGHLISAAAAINIVIFAAFATTALQGPGGASHAKISLHPYAALERALGEG